MEERPESDEKICTDEMEIEKQKEAKNLSERVGRLEKEGEVKRKTQRERERGENEKQLKRKKKEEGGKRREKKYE